MVRTGRKVDDVVARGGKGTLSSQRRRERTRIVPVPNAQLSACVGTAREEYGRHQLVQRAGRRLHLGPNAHTKPARRGRSHARTLARSQSASHIT